MDTKIKKNVGIGKHQPSNHLIFTNFTKHSLNSRRILRPFLGSNRYMCNQLTNVPRTGLDVDKIVKYTRPVIARLDNKFIGYE